jgi:hypothetical protein
VNAAVKQRFNPSENAIFPLKAITRHASTELNLYVNGCRLLGLDSEVREAKAFYASRASPHHAPATPDLKAAVSFLYYRTAHIAALVCAMIRFPGSQIAMSLLIHRAFKNSYSDMCIDVMMMLGGMMTGICIAVLTMYALNDDV